MELLPRLHAERLEKIIREGKKIAVVYGPRQSGKSTLVEQVTRNLPYKTLYVNADQQRFIETFSSRDLEKMNRVVSGFELVVIDEAQRIPDIGINLKILHDELKGMRLVATGSSSFELANQVKEPLTGRTVTLNLYPIGVCELATFQTPFEIRSQLDSFLLYGMYPERFSLTGQQAITNYLLELTSSYLYRDVLDLVEIRYSEKLYRLLQLLAFQIGSEVSLNELGRSLEISKDTVAYYIQLLEQAFVLFRLSGFSRNLRKEITKRDKIYFWDLGIRNALIEQFQPMHLRQDQGALWENFVIAERKKLLAYRQQRGKGYFWRTYTGAEIDYIEEKDGNLAAWEAKYSARKKKSVPKSWQETYPGTSFDLINPDNFLDFLS